MYTAIYCFYWLNASLKIKINILYYRSMLFTHNLIIFLINYDMLFVNYNVLIFPKICLIQYFSMIVL